MTRDEAIKAMREGKKCYHPLSPCRTWKIGIKSPEGKIFLYSCDAQGDWMFDIERLLHNDFDEGWEIVKAKLKKTFYVAIHFVDGTPDSVDDALLENKSSTEYYSDDDWKFFPVEIEVEE